MFGSGNLSKAAKELLFKSWRTKISRWNVDPISEPVSDVANFLADLHAKGYQTISLNAYRSTIFSVHDKVDDTDATTSPLLSYLGHSGRYPTMGDTDSLSLKLLTFKLVMLISLVRPSDSADLASCGIKNCQYNPEALHSYLLVWLSNPDRLDP